MSWGKRAGKLVLLLLLAELLFFFFVGLRLRRQVEGEREILGVRFEASLRARAAEQPQVILPIRERAASTQPGPLHVRDAGALVLEAR